MAQEINLGGTIYISSKRAAEMTGYTQDYVGQLARAGHIVAQRVSGLWYVVEDSLRNYKAKADEFKPTPPPVVRQEPQLESSVSFDGREYVSTQRAAEITGYHADYVGQLARTGKVLSRQVGNRWFVVREEVVEHKRHNDALLAAVQAESVGLMKQHEPMVEKKEEPEDLHFIYTPEEPATVPYLPRLDEKTPEGEQSAFDGGAESPDELVNEIPIRVIRPATDARMPRPDVRFGRAPTRYRSSRTAKLFISAIIFGLIGIGYAYISNEKMYASGISTIIGGIQNAVSDIPLDWLERRVHVPAFLVNELYYHRDSF